ncbi:28S ribosomal protein S9, mitochondrial [Iris pallida]|uniref:28S ribosomal protein S9, mitochondrial n=1 Tax=Iris pallida TaxID=29817 RepID=A0AAX6G9X9_IRIPA|nr:28S ribosomal protein S9, mitochondrial [Iris pallida]
MLSRLLPRSLPLRFRTLTLASSSSSRSIPSSPPLPNPNPNIPTFLHSLRPFSSSSSSNHGGDWKFPPETDEIASIFSVTDEPGIADIVLDDGYDKDKVGGGGIDGGGGGGGGWLEEEEKEAKVDIFAGIDLELAAAKDGGGWDTAEGYEPWSLGDGEGEKGGDKVEERTEEQRELERKEGELLATLKGPDRAFGDLIAASGITEDMIDSLILLKDVGGIEGLPPLEEIEDKALARMNAKSSRGEIERKKQEEIASARVRQVDEKGRAYGTGRRKCSVARVFIQPGDGKFIVNDKQFDAYFPIIDNRAELLRPFTVTNTLGLWDVTCTVKGGGVSGQVGAIRLGISRALQNWEPGLRQYLKPVGFLTRDPRVVERKKPGKAKARKSFQWVKR